MHARVLTSVLAAACGLTAQRPQPLNPLVTATTFTAWRDHILPGEDERRWRQLPWHQSFAAGLRTANEQARPLLFYAMNGHPLGCT